MKKKYLALSLFLLSPALLAQEPPAEVDKTKPVVQEGPVPATEAPEQEPEAKSETEAQKEGERPKVPIVPPGLGKNEQKSAEKIVELFKNVDKKMKAIDELLFDMGAGEVPLAMPEGSGLGDLLDLTRSASNDVVKDIDEILKIAEEMAESQSKPGGKGPPKPGQQGQEVSSQGEATLGQTAREALRLHARQGRRRHRRGER